MDPITVAMGLAQFAPQLVKWITGSDNAAAGAQKVVDIAGAVTGKGDPTEALAAIRADSALQIQFQQAVMANENDLTKAFLADVRDARNRDVELAKAGHHNYRASMLVAMAVSLVLLCMVIMVWHADTNDFVKATITLILGRALGWVEQVFSFEFGTTRSSATKDATINNLSK
ncbi:MAG: hypothetical protein YHS30scaffold667_9 [Phage 65_10]|nr:MAG: hypothetical protein YHS30scaffold667_9 [Phage 65_10]